MKSLITIANLLLVPCVWAQQDSVQSTQETSRRIQVFGQVKDTIRGDQTFQLMVVNKSRGIGHTGSWDGSFELK